MPERENIINVVVEFVSYIINNSIFDIQETFEYLGFKEIDLVDLIIYVETHFKCHISLNNDISLKDTPEDLINKIDKFLNDNR
jgi:acyl carrier protein